LATAAWDKIESGQKYEGAVTEHIIRILQDFPVSISCRVVVDPGCGAASLVTPYLLRRMGCDVIALNSYPSGFFPREIEPTSSNLTELIKATVTFKADVGIAHDGDADRMMAVDERGNFVSGDTLLAIFAREMGAKRVVTTVDASMTIEDMGFDVTRTRVGDTYVSEELKKEGDFGGEPSGAWVFPSVSLCADGIYAAARIASIARKKKLSELAGSIPSYPVRRGSTSSDGKSMSKIRERLMTLKPLSVNSVDGIKLNFPDGWLLVRPSGTEPKIRITTQAREEQRARELYQASLEIIEGSTEKMR
ncbi:MAG: phosphoglucosamine mutase, partial [Chloroflexota bacterium]